MVFKTLPRGSLFGLSPSQVVLTQADQLNEKQIERIENASDAILEVLEEVEG